jgi:serine/threonine-protein kinase
MGYLERLLPKVGDCIAGRYELLEVLGEGGFGIVYRANHTALGRSVALKLMHPHVVGSDRLVRRFEREVAVVKDLQHPNTIRINDFGTTDKDLPFYVMEYLRGRSLEEVLAQEGPLSPARTCRVMIQILKSLAEAHARGVVHRDLKPANVMICEIYGERDFVKVLDFGIAKALAAEDNVTQTQTGMLLGTPAYVSPEQARGEKTVDHHTDIYSAGLILAECLMGRRVVQENTPFESLAVHASERPLPFAEALKATDFWPTIEMSTRKRPDERFQSASDMAMALAALADLSDDPLFRLPTGEIELQPSPSTDLSTPSQRLAVAAAAAGPTQVSPRRSHRLVGGLVVLLALGAGVGLAINSGWFGSGRDGTGDWAAVPARRGSVDPIDQGRGSALASRTEEGSGRAAVLLAAAGSEMPLEDPLDGTGASVAAAEPVEVTPLIESVERLLRFATVATARGRLSASVPLTRSLPFEGQEAVSVSWGERRLGTTPFEWTDVPRLDLDLDLRFERRSYQPEVRAISLNAERVDVALARERRPEAASETPSEGPLEPDESEPTPTSPFGDTPILDRSLLERD